MIHSADETCKKKEITTEEKVMKINGFSENAVKSIKIEQNNNDTVKTTREQTSTTTNVTTYEDGVVLELGSTSAYQVGEIYDSSGNVVGRSSNVAATSLSTIQKQSIQSQLSALQLYSGPIDGNLDSDLSTKAMDAFKKVYGFENITDQNETVEKIDYIYGKYTEIMNSEGLRELYEEWGLDSTQRRSFAITWTFLQESLGFNDEQTAGVMGNLYAESAFSPDNAQDEFGYEGIHDTNYSFAPPDGVGYGLAQWTESSRKQLLWDVSRDLGYSVSNINSQLACMKEELINGDYRYVYENMNQNKTLYNATYIFLYEYENPEVKNLATRLSYANKIYDAMKGE